MDELSVAVPTKGVKYVFGCKCWLAKDRGDGLTSRVFNVLDAEAISICKRVCKHGPTGPKVMLQRNILKLRPWQQRYRGIWEKVTRDVSISGHL